MIDEVYVLQYHEWGLIEPEILSVRTDVTGSIADTSAHAAAKGHTLVGDKWEYADGKIASSYPHLVARIANRYTIERFDILWKFNSLIK